jgi:hypothetical protein
MGYIPMNQTGCVLKFPYDPNPTQFLYKSYEAKVQEQKEKRESPSGASGQSDYCTLDSRCELEPEMSLI